MMTKKPKGARVKVQQYIAFRIGNDKAGKYRHWNQFDEFHNTFLNADLDEINDIRQSARTIGIPVYYFEADDDTLEEATLLEPWESTPTTL